MKKIFFTIPLLLLIGCSTTQKSIKKQDYWAKPVQEVKLENFHQVDSKIYRSAQPSEDDFRQLYNYGIRNDLNLRQFHDDKEKLKNLPIKYYRIPINTSKMSYEQLVEAVAYLSKSNGKTLVHCLHGSDRTGTVIAGYRIAIEDWDKKKAIDEFINGGYGYHSFWFPNLPELLNSLDILKFKSDIKHFQFKTHTK